jgi:hypothetical protein
LLQLSFPALPLVSLSPLAHVSREVNIESVSSLLLQVRQLRHERQVGQVTHCKKINKNFPILSTLLFLHSSPGKLEMTYASIDLSWLPIVSIIFSVVTILVSFLETSKHIFQDNSWYLRVVIFLSIFCFRMATWICLVIVLAELIFIPILIAGITNATVLLIVQKKKISFEPISYALQSLVFPSTQMISANLDKENAKQIFISLTVVGNIFLAIVITVIFMLCSGDIYNPWKVSLSYPILISKDWFQAIFWSTIPMFFAATLPVPILLKFKR